MDFTLPPVIEHLLPQEVLPLAPSGSHGQSSTSTPINNETDVSTSTESTLPQIPITTTNSNSTTTPDPVSPTSLLQSPVNQLARRSIVNVTCRVQDDHTIRTTSGSGILIDKRGVVLTNAHVAYLYLLAGNDPNEDISCAVRTGNPASTTYQAVPLYISEAWIHDNARNIAEDEFYGTGEHDYALLAITSPASTGTPSFPALPLNSAPGTPTVASEVLVIAYPAEFLRGEDIRHDLYLTSDIGKVENQFTFMRTSPDLVTISGTILAQRGASGGAVVTKEGKLSGLVVTSTDAPDLKDRQLGAITISYINRDLEYQTDENIREFLNTDLDSLANRFTKIIAPDLAKELRRASE
jgi:S1-C subfamily serine protease